MRFLKFERFSADLICGGKLIHVFGRSTLKLCILFDDDNLNILDINSDLVFVNLST